MANVAGCAAVRASTVAPRSAVVVDLCYGFGAIRWHSLVESTSASASATPPTSTLSRWPAPGATSCLCRESFTKRPFDALPSSDRRAGCQRSLCSDQGDGACCRWKRGCTSRRSLSTVAQTRAAHSQATRQGSWQLVGTGGSSAARGRRAPGVVCRPDDAACRPTTHVERCRGLEATVITARRKPDGRGRNTVRWVRSSPSRPPVATRTHLRR
jgi:hypothetical protein